VMTVARFREIVNIRLLLEGLAVVLATPRIAKATIAEARGLAESFETEIKKPRPNRGLLVQRNQQLHFAVYRAAAAPLLLALIERMWLLHGPIVNYDLRQSTARLRNRPAIAHHQRLVEALERGDAEAARQALTADLVDAAEIIIGAGQFLEAADGVNSAAYPLDMTAILSLGAGVHEALQVSSPAPAATRVPANRR
jgi:DNA-binding GntR family transcriptional regulator